MFLERETLYCCGPYLFVTSNKIAQIRFGSDLVNGCKNWDRLLSGNIKLKTYFLTLSMANLILV